MEMHEKGYVGTSIAVRDIEKKKQKDKRQYRKKA